jgi:hypothetical protein
LLLLSFYIYLPLSSWSHVEKDGSVLMFCWNSMFFTLIDPVCPWPYFLARPQSQDRITLVLAKQKELTAKSALTLNNQRNESRQSLFKKKSMKFFLGLPRRW